MQWRMCLVTMLGTSIACGQADVPGAKWDPAYSGNQTAASRPNSHPIRYIVLHITEGSYAGAISWFKNPSARVSAHFVMRSSDGEVTQMVWFKDIGWHAGNWTYNTQSIGIEHEGRSSSPDWWTDALYRASTRVSRIVAKQYGIPRDRTRFIMHREVPGSSTGCPGTHFDPDYYLKLVMLHAETPVVSAPSRVRPGRPLTVTLRITNAGDLRWSPSGNEAVTLTATPVGRVSPFRDFTWRSPTEPARVHAATPALGVGEFKFQMMSPHAPGVYRETFQLRYADGTWFGPPIELSITVGEPGVLLDNGDANVSYTGTWSTGTSAAGRYGTDYRFRDTSPGSTAHASYFLNVPTYGAYDVYAWYPQGTNRSDVAPYTIEHAAGMSRVSVNQQVNGGKWVSLGRYLFPPGTGIVRLGTDAPSGKVVIADAIRAVRVQR